MTDGPARVLVAVVLDQDEAGVYWRDLDVALQAQRTELLWDVLILDVTRGAHPNYLAWLRAIRNGEVRPAGQHGRVRRLIDEDAGEDQVFVTKALQIRAGQDRAFELYCRWRSYGALWLLRPEAKPEPDALQMAWDNQTLLTVRPESSEPDEFDLEADPVAALDAAERVLGTVGKPDREAASTVMQSHTSARR